MPCWNCHTVPLCTTQMVIKNHVIPLKYRFSKVHAGFYQHRSGNDDSLRRGISKCNIKGIRLIQNLVTKFPTCRTRAGCLNVSIKPSITSNASYRDPAAPVWAWVERERVCRALEERMSSQLSLGQQAVHYFGPQSKDEIGISSWWFHCEMGSEEGQREG